jgi:hypothetical protein
MLQSIVKFYCFVVQTLLNMFRALQCPSSGARQTAVAASGFLMNVEVFSPPHSYGNQRLQRQLDGLLMMGIVMLECWAVSVRQSNNILRLIVASGWVFYLSDWRCKEPQTLNSVNTVLMLLMISASIARNMWSSQGTINCPTLLHLVGHFRISWCTEPWISNGMYSCVVKFSRNVRLPRACPSVSSWVWLSTWLFCSLDFLTFS